MRWIVDEQCNGLTANHALRHGRNSRRFGWNPAHLIPLGAAQPAPGIPLSKQACFSNGSHGGGDADR
jgi:hypothetical protein